MAATAPTPAELQALILQLQSQVTSLMSGAAPAGPAPAAVVFADTPQSLYADDLIDFSTKLGSSIYEQGCKTLDNKALTDGFGMTSDQTVVFIESLTRRATAMGWNAGSKQITIFTNRSGKDVPNKPQDACDSSTKPRNMAISESAVLETVQVDCSQVDSKDDSPLERYPKVVGISQAGSAPVKFSCLRSIFPKTAPASNIATKNVRAHPPASQFKSTNPFDSSPRPRRSSVHRGHRMTHPYFN